jgi:hypothetical protein
MVYITDFIAWEWSSFGHYSLREAGIVEIEPEWTAHDCEMLATRRIRKTVSRHRARSELVEGLAPKYGANPDWIRGKAQNEPSRLDLRNKSLGR